MKKIFIYFIVTGVLSCFSPALWSYSFTVQGGFYDSDYNPVAGKASGLITKVDKNDYIYNVVEYSDGKSSGFYGFGFYGIDSIQLPKQSGQNIGIFKMNPDGSIVWGKVIHAPRLDSSNPYGIKPTDLEIDSNGNIYVTGVFFKTVDFNPSQQTAYLTNSISNGGRDVFILRLTSNGNYSWVKQLKKSGDASEEGFSDAVNPQLTIDSSGNIVVADWFKGSIDLNPDPIYTDIKASDQLGDVFIVTLNQAGQRVRSGVIKGSSGEKVIAMKASSFGSIWIAGWGINVDVNPSATENLVGGYIYIAKISEDLNTVYWAGSISGDPSVKLSSMSQSSINFSDYYIYLAGTYEGNIDADPSGGINLLGTGAAGGRHAFLVSIDGNGAFQWAQKFGSESGNGAVQGGTVSLAANSESVYMSFSYNGVIDVNPGPGLLERTAEGGFSGDLYFRRLSRNGTIILDRSFEGLNYHTSGNDGYTPVTMAVDQLVNEMPFAGLEKGIILTGTLYHNGDTNPASARLPNLFADEPDSHFQAFISRIEESGFYVPAP